MQRKPWVCTGGTFDHFLPGSTRWLTLRPDRTWVLTGEDVVEPPKFTKEECEKQGVDPENFGVCEIGETVQF